MTETTGTNMTEIAHFDVDTTGKLRRRCADCGDYAEEQSIFCRRCGRLAELQIENTALRQLLGDLTAEMFGLVGSGDVYMHIAHTSDSGDVALLNPATADAFARALPLRSDDDDDPQAAESVPVA